MDENSISGVLLSWVPMVLLIGVWAYFMSNYVRKGPQKQIVDEYKKHNELIRQIIERMDQRITRLEERDRNGG